MQQIPAMDVVQADPATVRRWLDEGEAVLFDVRETVEYEQERIPGSTLVPLSTFNPSLIPREPGKKVVLHCAIGQRSAIAASLLMMAGYQDVINLAGGLQAWKEAGLATEIHPVQAKA